MASVFEILSQNNYDPIKSLIANEKAKLGQSTYVPYTEDFQFGTSESPTQTIYNPRKLELESEKKNIVAEANAAIATAQAATEQKRKDILAVKNIEADGKFVNYTGPEKSKVGVNDQYYDDNNVPKMSLVPEKEINTGNADYDAQPQFLYPEHKDGLKYQELGHGAGYVEPINPEKDAASEVFMSSIYNDDQVYQPNLNEALNNEILNTSDKDLKISSGVAGEKAQKEAKKNAENLVYEMKQERLLEESRALSEENLKQSGIKQSALQREKDVEKRIKDIEWEEYKKRSQKRTRENFEDALDTSTAPDTMATNLASIKDAEGKKIAYPDDIHGIGTSITEQTSNAEELAAEKAKKENETGLHNNQINNPTADDMGRSAEEEAKLKADAFRKKMDDAHKSYRPRTGPVEKSKTREKYATHGDKLGTPDLLTGKDPFRFSTLAYPMNITTDPEYGHYMLFYVNVQNKTGYKYAGYNDDDQLALIGDVIETQTFTSDTGTPDSITETTSTVPENRKYTTNYHVNRGAEFNDVAYHKSQHYNGLRGNHLQSNQVTLMRQRKATTGLAARVNTTTRVTDSVAMYLPADVNSNVSASYQGSDMGLLGFLALGGADVINQIKNRDFEGAADNFLGMGERALSEMIKKAGIAAVETGFGTSGTTEVFNKIFGQTTNPFLEVAFQNLGLRQFDYTFNFRPRSDVETDEVKAIIQLFRFHMAPELKGTNHRYMTLPSTFDIHYMYQSDPETAKENSFYNKIATCVLERCDVNYTPTGVKSFDDGAPTEISMSLGFKETELLTKQKINDGF